MFFKSLFILDTCSCKNVNMFYAMMHVLINYDYYYNYYYNTMTLGKLVIKCPRREHLRGHLITNFPTCHFGNLMFAHAC